MRHLFFIFMIALLPLRGWISDAMATDMAFTQAQHTQQTATKSIATHTDKTSAAPHFDFTLLKADTDQIAPDCSGHASEHEPHAADAHCDSCSACQVCHAIALSPATAAVVAVFNLSTLPRAAAAQFASASTALGEKPPIF